MSDYSGITITKMNNNDCSLTAILQFEEEVFRFRYFH